MTEFERELSNLSYTNKDFSTIYPELLDLAKKLSYKWDPTTSNESDPGVVLLKLAALMADKNNYNIDKNILELFPLSVSQDSNARQIFDQCGYCMKHYQAATTIATFSFVSDPEFKDSLKNRYGGDKDTQRAATRRYHVPRFTMITDADSSNVYTVVEPLFVDTSGYAATVDAEVMQGVAMNYAINGDYLITAENLDYNNRLYFSEQNIAENGIFIRHRDKENYEDWIKVDNLLTQPEKTTCYKFGITDGGATCYIEFPDDIVELIGEGINITYLLTDGGSGNIGKNRLTNWYGDISLNVWDCEYPEEVENVTVTSENIKITNVLPATSGKDPETIDEAYSNYERIKTTFDTLVSTQDYSNALVTTKSASNGFVCDRTNDVQSSYVVLNTDFDTRRNTYIVKSEKREQEVTIPVGTEINGKVLTETVTLPAFTHDPELDAFDLRIYAFEYTDNDASLKSYVRSYTVADDYGSESMKTGYFGAIHELKTIEHNFPAFIENRIILLKNKFPLIARIIPSFKLTATQQNDIITKVHTALYKQLHSSNVSFSEAGAYDIIYDTILNADPRIKALALDDLTYETYAVFKHEGEFYELRIDDGSQGYCAVESMSSSMYDNNINYYTYIPSEDRFEGPVDSFRTNETYYHKEFESLWKEFRKEVYARSVLAGNTPLFEDDNLVSWSANMSVDTNKMIDNAYYLKTDTTMRFVQLDDASSSKYALNGNSATKDVFGVQPNENLIFTRPALIVEKSYASYVKVFYKIDHLWDSEKDTDQDKYDDGKPRVILKKSDYTLQEGEYIVFLWKTEDSDYAPYSYVRYDAGTIISPTYDMTAQTVDVDVKGTAEGSSITKETRLLTDVYNLNATFPAGTTSSSVTSFEVTSSEVYAQELPTEIKSFINPQFVLSGERQVDIKTTNTVKLPKNIYFMMNDGSYTMFDYAHIDDIPTVANGGIVQDGTKYTITESYTLQTGEYLIYTNESKTQLVMLEGGTKITRSYTHNRSESRAPWCIDSYHQVSNAEFVSQGVDAIDNHWYTIDPIEFNNVVATETEYVQLGQDIRVEIDFRKTPAELRSELGTNSDGSYRMQIVGEPVSEGSSVVYDPEDKKNVIELKDGRLPLADSVIEYWTRETGTWRRTQLAQINNRATCWQMHAILNVSCSNKQYQILQKHQTVTALDDKQEVVESYTDCHIKSNKPVNGTGPLINVQTWDTSVSMYTPASIVSFRLDSSDDSTDKTFNFAQSSNEGTCILSGPHVTKSVLINNQFAKGYYVDSTNHVSFNPHKETVATSTGTVYENIKFVWNTETEKSEFGNLVANISLSGLLTITRADETEYADLPKEMIFDQYSFTAEADEDNMLIKFNLPTGDYLLPLTLVSSFPELTVSLRKEGQFVDNGGNTRTVTSLPIKIDVVQNCCVEDGDRIDWIHVPGKYFLQLTLDDVDFSYEDIGGSKYEHVTVTGYELLFEGTVNDANTIIVGSPFKYTNKKHLMSKNMNKYPYREDDFDEVLKHIVLMDKNKIFDYTYQIPEEYIITCPTSSNAFLDKQHCMNPYTICQWDVYSKNNSVLVLNKLKQ